MNNLLSLQENHVEEFFQYHGEQFLVALEKLMEDVVERVVSQMFAKLSFDSNGSAILRLIEMLFVNTKELLKKILI